MPVSKKRKKAVSKQRSKDAASIQHRKNVREMLQTLAALDEHEQKLLAEQESDDNKENQDGE